MSGSILLRPQAGRNCRERSEFFWNRVRVREETDIPSIEIGRFSDAAFSGWRFSGCGRDRVRRDRRADRHRLIGALVGTRGSLSSIFGVASSAMGSANGGSAASSSNPVTSQRAITDPSTSYRAPFWNAKTLSSKVVTNPNATSQLTTFTYTDGSSGSYLAQYDSTGKLTVRS